MTCNDCKLAKEMTEADEKHRLPNGRLEESYLKMRRRQVMNNELCDSHCFKHWEDVHGVVGNGKKENKN